jgi:hypothetical protein
MEKQEEAETQAIRKWLQMVDKPLVEEEPELDKSSKEKGE